MISITYFFKKCKRFYLKIQISENLVLSSGISWQFVKNDRKYSVNFGQGVEFQ